MEITFTQDGLFGVAILLAIIVVIFLVVREFRLMRTNTRKLELELEREKLNILKQDTHSTIEPSLRLSTEQISSLRGIEESNLSLETDLVMKQKEVEGRLKRLENSVKREKLDLMLDKIQQEEQKIL